MVGPYFMDIEIPARPPSPVVSEDEYVKDVWSGKKWYSSIRKDYQRAVCVLWADGTITVEPVCNLIDFVNQEVCKNMIPVLYNWRVSVKNNLCKTKKCAFCNDPRKNDNFLCKECEESTIWLDTFINNEQILRENIYISDQYIDKIINIIPPDPKRIKIPESFFRKRKLCDMEQNLINLDKLLMDTTI
tara:strand:- start:273 stop:836 length:564 start_codon:yes stop_codon:yes gene_type:complete